MEDTWLKMYRKFEDWGWYQDIPTKVLFIHLLIKANWKESIYMGHPVPVGGKIIGRKSLSIETGLSEQQVRSSLEKLKSTGEITIKTTNKFSIVVVQNWGKYQSDNHQNNQQITNKQPTSNQQITTELEGNKVIKKERTNTYTESFEIFWKEYPNRVGKPDAFKKYKESQHSEIMDGLQRWKEFWDYSETEPRFIPHPATWLNQERYKDEPPETKTKTLSFKI